MERSIDKIACINLKRRPLRLAAWIGAFDSQQVTLAEMFRFEGKDSKDYEYKDLIKDVIKDGFPIFEIYLTEAKNDKEWLYLAAHWSYLRALRWIAKQKETVLLMEDDWILIKNFYSLLKIYQEIPSADIVQLTWNTDETLANPVKQVSPHWCQGSKSKGTSANIYTPKGAQMLLNDCSDDYESTIEDFIKKQYINHPNVFSSIYSDIFVKYSLYGGYSDVCPWHNTPDLIYEITTIDK